MKENLGVHQILALTENPSLIWTVLEYSLNKKEVGVDLFSRSVARQVSSAPHSLTSVFGMGTGGPCAIKTPTTVPVEAISGSFSFNCLTLPKISTTLILFLFCGLFLPFRLSTRVEVLALTYFPSSSPSKYFRLRTA